MPAVSLVAVWTLDEDGTVAEALCEHLPSDVIQPDATTCTPKRKEVIMAFYYRKYGYSTVVTRLDTQQQTLGFQPRSSRRDKQQFTPLPSCTYVSPCHFHSCVPVDVAEQPQTEAFRVGGVGEAIDRQRRLRGVERLSDSLVQLIVGY